MPQTEKKRKSTAAPGAATQIVDRMYPNRVALSDDIKKQVVAVMQGEPCRSNGYVFPGEVRALERQGR